MAIVVRDLALMPYEIDIDDKNFTLVHVKKGADGTEKREVVGYHGDLASCLLRVTREKMVSKNKVFTLRSFLDEYRKMIDTFRKLVESAMSATKE